MIEFDKDELRVNDYIKSHSSAFNMIDALNVVSARSDIAEMMLDARIEAAVTYGGLTPEDAEEKILAELEASK